MSGLTVLFLVVALGTIAYIQAGVRNRWSDVALIVTFPALFILTMTLEGFRPYLMPLYLSCWMTYGLYMGLIGLRSRGKFKITKKAVWILSLLILLPAILQMVMFPVGETPRLNGQYPTGTKTFILPFSSVSSGTEEAMPQALRGRFIYPSGGIGIKRAPWFENGKALKSRISKATGIPWIYMGNLDLVKSQAMYDVPPAGEIKKFPVIIMSPPWRGFGDEMVPVAEALASRGYAVLIVESTMTSGGMFLDGKVTDIVGEMDFNVMEEQLDQAILLLERLNAGEGMERMKDRLVLDHIVFIGYGPSGRVLMQPGAVHMEIAAQVLVEPYTKGNERLGAFAFKQQTSILASGEGASIAIAQGMRGIINASGGMCEWKYIPGTSSKDFGLLYLINPLIRFSEKGIDALTGTWSDTIVQVLCDEVDEVMRKTGVQRPHHENEKENVHFVNLVE